MAETIKPEFWETPKGKDKEEKEEPGKVTKKEWSRQSGVIESKGVEYFKKEEW